MKVGRPTNKRIRLQIADAKQAEPEGEMSNVQPVVTVTSLWLSWALTLSCSIHMLAFLLIAPLTPVVVYLCLSLFPRCHLSYRSLCLLALLRSYISAAVPIYTLNPPSQFLSALPSLLFIQLRILLLVCLPLFLPYFFLLPSNLISALHR